MNIQGITAEMVNSRIQEVNKEAPLIWATSLIKSPQEITVRTTAMNK